jgi:hypothetical protein
MKTRESGVFAGVAIAALGGALALVAYVQPQQMRAPAAVVYASALAFVFAGWMVVARARGHRLLKAWLPVPLLACLVAPALWIAFASGHRRCGLEAARGMVRILGTRSDLPCRLGFGVAAIVGLVLVFLSIRQAVRSSRDPSA